MCQRIPLREKVIVTLVVLVFVTACLTGLVMAASAIHPIAGMVATIVLFLLYVVLLLFAFWTEIEFGGKFSNSWSYASWKLHEKFHWNASV